MPFKMASGKNMHKSRPLFLVKIHLEKPFKMAYDQGQENRKEDKANGIEHNQGTLQKHFGNAFRD